MSLFVQEAGPVDAPSVVFLHGGGGAGWMWRPQVEGLTEFHCLVPDLPGQGRSEGPFTMSSAADQVADLIRTRAHGGRAHVVGLSEGAQVLVALLATQPELVDTAIVSSALVRPVPGARFMTPGVIRWSYRLSVAPLRGVDWWIRLNMRRAAGVPDAYFAEFRQSFRSQSEDAFTDLMVANQRFRLPAGLEGVSAPTLIVVGHREYEVMRASALDLAAAIPGARAVEVVHEGKLSVAQEHNWNMVAPQLFNDVVRAWIGGEPLPGALRPLAGQGAAAAG